ncbi:MAG TPA: hypothetical protein DCY94_04600 [Firmicutes bacterium]|nr:hypothetical protein [Bacillota bacterium]
MKMQYLNELLPLLIFSSGSIATFYGAYLLESRSTHLELCRKEKKEFKIETFPPILETPTLDIEGLNPSIQNIILEFIRTIESVPNANLDAFYANFKKDKIRISEKGTMIPKLTSDELEVNLHGELRTQLFPFLLKEAATRCKDNTRAIGFARYDDLKGKKIGSHLSSSYTYLLLERYFNLFFSRSASTLSFDITKYIEWLVGKDTMENLYFRGALDQLVEKLSVYSSRKRVIEMLLEFDNLGLKDNRRNQHYTNLAYREFILKLTHMGIRKLRLDPPESEEELKYALMRINTLSFNSYRIGKRNYAPSLKMSIDAEKIYEKEIEHYRKSTNL